MASNGTVVVGIDKVSPERVAHNGYDWSGMVGKFFCRDYVSAMGYAVRVVCVENNYGGWQHVARYVGTTTGMRPVAWELEVL